ncbi:hypothetical protein [Pseudonocardia sp. GCM10023141]|uniref:hypothetical protein n=1 Tax=Pseudonocardia sp. GCM10023141 TaxID=3252653 RepID=UPI003610DC96
MTLPNASDAPPLHTDADVLERVRQIVGPAIAASQLWIMFVDGDGRQAPVVMPVSDVPRHPPTGLLAGLTGVIGGLHRELITDRGSGSVILTYERVGPDAVQPADREWAAALIGCCERAGMALRGIFLSTRAGVRRL